MKIRSLVVGGFLSLVTATSATSAVALTGNNQTFVQTTRMFYWLAFGFPTEAAFNDATDGMGEVTKELIPDHKGMAGRIEGFRSAVASALVTEYPSITSCSKTPTSGSFNPSDSEEIELKEATVTPPASFPVTTKYEKRAVYTKTVSATKKYVVDFQWTCDKPVMYAKFDRYVSDVKTSGYGIFYDRSDSTNGHIQLYMMDTAGSFGGKSIYLALHVNILADNKYKLWVTRSGLDNNDTVGAYRLVAHGNYSTGQTTIMFQGVENGTSGTAQTYDQIVADTSNLGAKFASVTVDGGVAKPNRGSDQSDRMAFCSPDWDTNPDTITSNAACTGSELSVAPAPGLASDGDMSMKWIHDNLATKLGAL